MSGACHRRKGDRVERTVVRALQDHGLAACATSSPRRDSPVTCRACGKRVSRRGRSQIYCSRRCRQRAYWDRRVLAGISTIVTHGSGHSTTPRKSFSKIKGLPKTKSRPSNSFSTPVNVLGGGQWRWPNSTRLDAQTLAKISTQRDWLGLLPFQERICIMIKLKPNDVAELETAIAKSVDIEPDKTDNTLGAARPAKRECGRAA